MCRGCFADLGHYMPKGGDNQGAAEGKTKGTTFVVPFVLVRLKGFEPPTYWFVASHSIQLSYSRIP